jgi:hypothetical protein
MARKIFSVPFLQNPMGFRHVHMDQTLLLLPVITGYAGSGMRAESAVMPGNEFLDKRISPAGTAQRR